MCATFQEIMNRNQFMECQNDRMTEGNTIGGGIKIRVSNYVLLVKTIITQAINVYQ
jgi:hypothetical protein